MRRETEVETNLDDQEHPPPASVTVGGTQSYLPAQPTPFVGREEELSEILRRLQDPECRLLTLVGPGGMGKTRLAIETAQCVLDNPSTEGGFDHGVFFVPLQPVSAESGIVSAIADAVGFHFYSDVPPREQLLGYLRGKRILLLLDNFEHLLAGVDLVAEILTAASNVKILVTSREGLRLRQEWFHPLTGMRFSGDPTAREQEVSNYDAVRLFAQNARRALPRFRLMEEKDHVVRICMLVDGMPLGIELAAAWLKVLSCAQIANEIERGLDILTARHQDIPERHRSMRVLLEHSCLLLSENEQDALKRLSVFQGGFSLDAAKKIAGTSLLTLATLVEKSLLQVTPGGRYHMHELLRQYGAEKLGMQEKEVEETRDRHADYYSKYLHQRHEELKRSEQQNALMELDEERGNLHVAWQRATTQHNLDQVEQAIDGLGRFYEWTGNLSDGAAVFTAVGDDPDYLVNPRFRQVQAHTLVWAANFELMSGHADAAEEQLKRSIRTLDDLESAGTDVRWEKALALLHWGHLEQPRDLDAAVSAYRQSSEYYAEMGHRWEEATARAWLGETEREIGHIDQAVSLLRKARTVFEEFGDQRSVAMVLENIARAYLLDQADLEIALDTAQKGLQLRRQSGDRVGIATTLLVLSYVYCWLNQPVEAEPLMEEALEIAKNLGHKSSECEAYYIASVIYNYLEDTERKRAVGERGLDLARELGDVRLMSNFLRSLGTQVLIEGDVGAAHRMHVEAFEVQEQAGIQVMLSWLHVVRAYSSWKLDNFDEAQVHAKYALEASIEHSDLYTVVHALLFLAQVLATSGDVERAVEIGSTARAVSRWDKSLTGRKVFVEPFEKLIECLSPEAVEVAKERGQDRDVFETAAKLLEEVQDPSWRWA